MAFPTSSLTNNQVHKEGNRAFVYDSALGVWDQVRETDRTENKILQGEIGSGVTFPAGHVIQTGGYDWGANNSSYLANVAASATLWSREINITSGNKVVVCFSFIYEKTTTTNTHHGRTYISGSSGSGIGSTTSGLLMEQAMGYYVGHGPFLANISTQVISGVTSTATPTYSVYYYEAAAGSNFHFYQPHLVWFEIQQ